MDAPLLEIEPRELRFTCIFLSSTESGREFYCSVTDIVVDTAKVVEFKKQSTCSIRLINNTNDHVAFKVKTTAPKKYCVRPNVGIVPPKSSFVFMVTMQAQRTAPPDLICKDKFLLQSTVVPDNATEEDITSSMFSKEDGKYVEEAKLKVALMSPPRSPLLMPMNGTLKQEQNDASEPKEQFFSGIDFLNPERMAIKDYGPIFSQRKNVSSIKVANGEVRPVTDVKIEEGSEVARKEAFDSPKMVNEVIQPPKNVELEDVLKLTTTRNVESPKVVEDVSKLTTTRNVESPKVVEDVSKLTTTRDVKSPKVVKDVINPENMVKVVDDNSIDPETPKKEEDSELCSKMNVEGGDLVRDVEDIKSQLNKLESKLVETEVRILKLAEEMRSSAQETQYLRGELALLRNRNGVKQVQVGFPLLYVVMVALIGVILGYLLHSSQ